MQDAFCGCFSTTLEENRVPMRFIVVAVQISVSRSRWSAHWTWVSFKRLFLLRLFTPLHCKLIFWTNCALVRFNLITFDLKLHIFHCTFLLWFLFCCSFKYLMFVTYFISLFANLSTCMWSSFFPLFLFVNDIFFFFYAGKSFKNGEPSAMCTVASCLTLFSTKCLTKYFTLRKKQFLDETESSSSPCGKNNNWRRPNRSKEQLSRQGTTLHEKYCRCGGSTATRRVKTAPRSIPGTRVFLLTMRNTLAQANLAISQQQHHNRSHSHWWILSFFGTPSSRAAELLASLCLNCAPFLHKHNQG